MPIIVHCSPRGESDRLPSRVSFKGRGVAEDFKIPEIGNRTFSRVIHSALYYTYEENKLLSTKTESSNNSQIENRANGVCNFHMFFFQIVYPAAAGSHCQSDTIQHTASGQCHFANLEIKTHCKNFLAFDI